MSRSFILLLLICLSFADCNGQMNMAVSKSDVLKTNYSHSKIIKMTNGQSLAYIEKGSGDQTLLMIHGLGSNSLAWKKMMENLQADFRCIAIDLPNYGLSQVADHPFSMSAFAITVKQFIAEMQLQNVVLIGHSMGGQIAMTTVLETDAPIKKLVLLAPAGLETFSENDRQWFRQVVSPEAMMSLPDERIEQNFDLNFYGNKLPEDARFMLEERLQLKEDETVLANYYDMYVKCIHGMLDGPVFDRLDKIKTPVFVAYGKDDLLIPNRLLHPILTIEKVVADAVEKMPDCEVHFLEKCGHFIIWDQADAVSELIRSFVKK